MLQSIREHTKGWIAGLILVILVIPFALWGVNNYFVAQVDSWVAKVNGEEISLAQFQQEYGDYRQQMRQRLGENFEPEAFETLDAKREFLQNLIRQRVLLQTAREAGYTISSQTLAETIASYPAFQVEGQFNARRYQQILTQTGMSPRQFETRVRESLLTRSLAQGLGTSSLATRQEITDLIRITNQTRSFDYFLLDARAYREQVEVTDNEVLHYYQTHPDEFMAPETVSIRYLELSAEDLADEVTVDEAALRTYFDANRADYLTAEQRLASHILIAVPDDAEPAAAQAALEQAQALVEKLRSGADFAALAKTESDDIGSAAEGGKLGWIERGQMASSFEDALFSLEPGEVSDPVRTSFGYHIIKLRDIQEPQGQTFAEAKARVRADYKASEAERLYLEQADRLVNLTYRNPSSLQPAAEALGLEIQSAGPFSREGTENGFASRENVVETAFSDLVLVEKMNSDPVELAQNSIAILRVVEHQQAELKPVSAVRDEIREILIRQQSRKLARSEAEALAQQVQAGGAKLAGLAEKHGVEVVQAESARRGAQAHPEALLEEVFQLPAPEGEAGIHAVPAGEGQFAVVALRNIKAGSGTEDSAGLQRQILERRIQQVYLNAELQALLERLVAKAEVEIAEERL